MLVQCSRPWYRLCLPFCAALLSLFIAAAVTRAETQPVTLIERIDVRNNFEIQDQVITHPLTRKEGDPYDEKILRQDFRRIMDTGFFDRVVLQVGDGERGKILVFWVQEKPVIKSVDFRGVKKAMSKQKLEEMLQDESLELKINSRLDYSMVEKVRKAVKDLLFEKGYEDAQVDSEIQTVSEVARAVYFNIKEGKKVKIGEVDFTGNTVFKDKKLKRKMKKTKGTWMFSWITQHNVYGRTKYEEDIQKVEYLYKDAGYARVNILDPAVERYNIAKEGKDPKTRLRITIPIEEGEQYTVGAIDVRGNELFTDDEILQQLYLKEGDIFDQSTLRDMLETMDISYGVRGYIFAYTDPIPDFDDEALTVGLTLDVVEGEKFFLRNLEFEGNTSTRDKVLRREMRIREGDVFNEEAFKNSLLKVNQLGYFALLEEENNPEIIPSMEGNEVDVIIKGQESGRNQLEVGGGVSGLEGAFGRVLFSTRNFLGRGEILSAEALIGTRSDRYGLNFTEPYIFDKPYIFGAELYRRNYFYYDHRQRRTGAATRFGMPLGYFSRFMVRYAYEIIDIEFRKDGLREFDPVLRPPDQLEEAPPPMGTFSFRNLYEEGETRTSSVTPMYTFSTVNNPFRASRGQEFNLSFQIAGGALGGENYFYKPRASYSRYLPIFRKTFFAFHGVGTYIIPYGDRDLPGFERLFLGGEMSIRGTKIRSVGPYDERGNFIGGTSSFVGNFEYHIPIKETPLEGLLFFDAGNAWDEDNVFNFNDLVLSYGVELRVYLPIFPYPLRFIYAFLPDPPLRNSSTDFQFTVGSTF